MSGAGRSAADRRAVTASAARLALATFGAIAVLAFGPHAATPGTAGPGGWPGIVAGPPAVAAASPEASTPGGDTRSAGEGPGLVGAPFLAVIGVIALGLLAAGATLLYLRLAAGPAVRDGRAGKDRPNRRN